MFIIPGRKTQVRLFDRVATIDDQYDIFDVGLQYEDGGIDSITFGGSFHSLKKAIKRMNDEAALDDKAAVSTAQPVVNHAGESVDVEGL
jgi:hypothetical protein